MFASGGGGFPLPRVDGPVEMLVILAILGLLVWLLARLFST